MSRSNLRLGTRKRRGQLAPSLRFGCAAVLAIVVAACLAPERGYAKVQLALDSATKRPVELNTPFAPGLVLFRPGDNVFVAATDPSAVPGRLVGFAAGSWQKLFELEIPHSIDAMTFSPSGDALVLVGRSAGAGYVTRLQMPKAEIVSMPTLLTYRLPRAFTQPSVAMAPDRAVLVTEGTSNRLLTIPASEFKGEPGEIGLAVLGRESELAFTYLGVHTLAVARGSNLAFISQEASPTITALRLGSNSKSAQLVDEFARTNAKHVFDSGGPVPLAMFVTNGQASQDSKDAVASLLLADRTALALTVVDYDPVFRALDVVATAPIGLKLDLKTSFVHDPATGLRRQTLLLASDNNQDAILIGDASVSQLVEMTRDSTTRVLERVGDIDLGGTPRSLSISSDGLAAVAVVSQAGATTLRGLTNSTAPVPTTDQTVNVKQLQRELNGLGLNTGSIDGILGPATLNAMVVFNNATGNTISTRNLADAVDHLATFRNKCGDVGGVTGLSCLLLGKAVKPKE